MKGSFSRILLILVIAVAALAFYSRQPGFETRAEAHVKPQPTAGECAPHSDGYGSPSDYEVVACPSGKCVSGAKGSDVDRWIDFGDDEPVCLRPGTTDKFEWTGKRNFLIKSIVSGPAGKHGHPFDKDPPYARDSSGKITSPALRAKLPALPTGQCYLFKPMIEVRDKQGKASCYDPHIYTGR